MKILGFEIKRVESAYDMAARAIAERDRRSSSSGLKNPEPWLIDALGGVPGAAGVTVTEEGAMRISAVYSCVRVLSETISSLPLKLYRRTDEGRTLATDHPLYRVLHHQFNPLMSSMQGREVMQVSLELWGNAYAEIQHNGRGDIVALWPIPPNMVQVERFAANGQPQRRYHVAGVSRPFRQEEILHVPGLGFDGYEGKGPIRLLREGLGIAVSAERYGAKFFANDTRSGVVLETDQILEDDDFDRIKKEWAGYEGSIQAWRTKILEGGLKMKTIGLPPGDAQFIQTRSFQRGEICGAYGVPPHMIGDTEKSTAWGTGIEQLSIGFVTYSLRPRFVRFEQAVEMQLLDEDERDQYYAEHVADGLLRGDVQARTQAYVNGRNWGWFSADDVRRLENMEPLPNGLGTTYLQPLNMVPAGTDPNAAADEDVFGFRAGRPALPKSLNRPATRASLPARYGVARAMETVFRDALRRIVKRETSEIRKAVKKYIEAGDIDGFRTWLDDFAEEHAGWMESRMLPVYEMMAEAMVEAAKGELGTEIDPDELGDFVARYNSGFTRRHSFTSRRVLTGLLDEEDPDAALTERLDAWDENRAGQDARTERVRSSEAFTKAIWAVAGVTTLTWRAAGSESCDACQSLDGRTVSIQAPFANPGDDIAGMAMHTRIGHPPLHNGCVCTLTPGGHRAAFNKTEIRALLTRIIEEAHTTTTTTGECHHAVED